LVDSKWLQSFVKQLRNPKVSILFIAVVFTIIFYFVPYYGPWLFLITVSFLVADSFPLLLTRGGYGIFQFGFSTKTQYKGHAFLGFVFSIILTSIVIEILLMVAVEIMAWFFQYVWVCLIVGFLLSALAYFDMNKRFYQH
jgi:hypothetical protein